MLRPRRVGIHRIERLTYYRLIDPVLSRCVFVPKLGSELWAMNGYYYEIGSDAKVRHPLYRKTLHIA
jgi:hypothetical protein